MEGVVVTGERSSITGWAAVFSPSAGRLFDIGIPGVCETAPTELELLDMRLKATIDSTMMLASRRMEAGDDFSGLYIFSAP